MPILPDRHRAPHLFSTALVPRRLQVMAVDPRKRKEKLERRAAKRKAKQKSLVVQKTSEQALRFSAAADAPFLDSGAAATLWSEGLGSVWLSRQLPDGSIAAAVFMVDRYCLGVKDAFRKIFSRFDYEND